MRLLALRKKYEANIDIAKANLDVLLHSAVGIGEHSDLTAEMDKWIGEIASNQDKIDAIDELNRFIEIYPNHERIVYAYYLLGMCHYEQIADEKKDLGSIIDAVITKTRIIEKIPSSLILKNLSNILINLLQIS